MHSVPFYAVCRQHGGVSTAVRQGSRQRLCSFTDAAYPLRVKGVRGTTPTDNPRRENGQSAANGTWMRGKRPRARRIAARSWLENGNMKGIRNQLLMFGVVLLVVLSVSDAGDDQNNNHGDQKPSCGLHRQISPASSFFADIRFLSTSSL